ncbi:hypothetical protein E2C01_045286 [Portunus trituberculatus]|uniref:Uncharacterized protein n=1 Tax=Portunus trituberculatus TaxID=210409 RepID=A0A5B7FVC8_PORTR|nr:hypothetical protein [Portunus trituberculatus]
MPPKTPIHTHQNNHARRTSPSPTATSHSTTDSPHGLAAMKNTITKYQYPSQTSSLAAKERYTLPGKKTGTDLPSLSRHPPEVTGQEQSDSVVTSPRFPRQSQPIFSVTRWGELGEEDRLGGLTEAGNWRRKSCLKLLSLEIGRWDGSDNGVGETNKQNGKTDRRKERRTSGL